MDDADIAGRNQEILDGMALAAQLAAIPTGEAAMECEECGASIPEARRKAAPGCRRCIGCQTTFERRAKERQ